MDDFDQLFSPSQDGDDADGRDGGFTPSNPGMVPGGGAFTLRQWGRMYQARSDWQNSLSAQSDVPDTTGQGGGAQGSGGQLAQMLPPTLLTEPPIEGGPTVPPEVVPKAPVDPVPTPTVPSPVPPPLPEYPSDPTKPPGPGWEWRGNGPPESGKGAWIRDGTEETLHPDFDHPPPVKPHYDYGPPEGSKQYPNKRGYRWYPDGTMEPRSLLPPEYTA